MLVLSRQRDETIMIGDEIEITVVDIRGDKVRLGIAAPTRIAVHRKEVYESIRRENEEAARLDRRDAEALRQSIAPGPTRTRSRLRGLGLGAPVRPGVNETGGRAPPPGPAPSPLPALPHRLS